MLTRFKNEVDQTREKLIGYECELELRIVMDAEGHALSVSTGYESVLGYRQSDLEGRVIFPYIHPEDREHTRNVFREIVNTYEPRHATVRVAHRTESRWVILECCGTPLVVDGVRQGFVVFSRPIGTETVVPSRKMDDEMIDASNPSTLDTALKQMCLDPDYAKQQIERCRKLFARAGVERYMVIDACGITRYASEGHEEFTGWTPAELVGQNNMEKVHPDDVERAQDEMRFMILHKTTDGVEYRFLHKDGRWVTTRIFAAPIMQDGVFYGLLVVAHEKPIFDLRALMNKVDFDVRCVIETLSLKAISEPGI